MNNPGFEFRGIQSPHHPRRVPALSLVLLLLALSVLLHSVMFQIICYASK